MIHSANKQPPSFTVSPSVRDSNGIQTVKTISVSITPKCSLFWDLEQHGITQENLVVVGCMAGRWSVTGELTMSYARPAADM